MTTQGLEAIATMVRDLRTTVYQGRTLEDLARDSAVDWPEVEAGAIKGSALLAFPDGSIGVTDDGPNAEALPAGTLRARNLRRWCATGSGEIG